MVSLTGRPFQYRWVMIGLGFLVTFTMHLLLFSHSTLTPSIMDDMGLDFTQASFIFSLSVLILTLSRIPWGLLCDRVGLKTAMGMAITFMGTFGFLRSFSTSFETLLALQVLLGVGLGGTMPALPKLVANWFPREEFGAATGIYIAGFSVGNIIGLGLTPYIFNLVGSSWRSVFQLYGAWGLVLTFLWWIMSREGLKAQKIQLNISVKEGLSLAIKSREVWVLTGLYLLAGGIYDTTCIWLPSSLELSGVPMKAAGLIAMMLPVGNLFAGPAVGKLSDLAGLRRPFLLVLALVSGPAVFLAWTTLGTIALVAAFLVGFSTLGIISLTLTVPVESPGLAPRLGGVVGVITSVGNLNSILMPIVAGYSRDVTKSFLPAAVLLAIMGEIMVILGLMLEETGRKKRA